MMRTTSSDGSQTSSTEPPRRNPGAARRATRRLLPRAEHGLTDEPDVAETAILERQLVALGADVVLVCRAHLERIVANRLPRTSWTCCGAILIPDR